MARSPSHGKHPSPLVSSRRIPPQLRLAFLDLGSSPEMLCHPGLVRVLLREWIYLRLSHLRGYSAPGRIQFPRAQSVLDCLLSGLLTCLLLLLSSLWGFPQTPFKCKPSPINCSHLSFFFLAISSPVYLFHQLLI